MIAPTMKRLSAALLFATLLAVPPVARADDAQLLLPPEREEWLHLADAILAGNDQAARGADPLLAPMELCEQRGCTRHAWQALSADEAARVRALFDGETDSAGERHRVGQAIALLETFMGTRNGTWRDHAANEREYEDEPGQMDCIAESINARTYVDRLHRAGLLHHHQPGGFIHRYTVVLQHVAVDMVETATEERFAVDSWVGANGEEPDIIPYGDWRWEWGV